MNIKYILIILLFGLLTACSTIKVVPEQVSGGIINLAENSQKIDNNGVEITAKVSDLELNSYNLEGVVTSFAISIFNGKQDEISFSEDSFFIVDDKGVQYPLLTPEKVREMIKKDSYYLMPYPYVGFYYLEDFQKTSFYNRITSSLPYFYELYPQDIFTKFLPLTGIIPGKKIEGLLYFKIDIANYQGLNLYIYQKGSAKSSKPDFIFPFKILK